MLKKKKIFTIASMIVTVINIKIIGPVNLGFMEYFCSRVTKKKLTKMISSKRQK